MNPSSLREKGVEYAKKAVEEDNAGNYQKAYNTYITSLNYFQAHMKHETNPDMQKTLKQAIKDYLTRAEQLKEQITNGTEKAKAPVADGNGNGKDGSAKNNNSNGNEDGEKGKLREALGQAILTEKPNVMWSDVAGLDTAKDALKEAVILPVKFPQFFTGNRKAWSGFLLFGPPGTGKSYLAKAVATEAESTFFSVSSSALVSKWMGESEKLVSQLFQMAHEKSPSIIFIDEIDSLCGQRGSSGESEAARRIKTEILVQMQGVSSENGQVLVLAATNTPYSLDQAVRRRFDRRIYIPLPDATARTRMFSINLGETPHSLTESDLRHLGECTDGFSGSDIATMVKDVLFQPVRKTQEATHFRRRKGNKGEGESMFEPCSPGERGAFEASLDSLASSGYSKQVAPPPITREDMERALARARPTVSEDDLAEYYRFAEEFGERG